MTDNIQTTGLDRNTIDKYYTKPSVVSTCIDLICSHLKINKKNDIVIEPSAGDGVFYKPLKAIVDNVRMFDIKPGSADIVQCDYLITPLDVLCPVNTASQKRLVHVIGNPPFGRQSTLANKFIRKSVTYCDTVSFILPKSFKKASMHRAFPLSFHLVATIDLPPNSFFVNGNDHDSPCVFQIWIKKDTLRDVPIPVAPIGFTFVKKTENPNVSVRRVGANAGLVSDIIDTKSEQSHYFLSIVVDDQSTSTSTLSMTIENLNKIEHVFDNTVGPKSLSKPEIIHQFNAVIQ